LPQLACSSASIFSFFRFTSRGFALPTLFMNAGNMGIPLALFAFGPAGMQRATLMFVMLTLLQYSLGIYILNGHGNWTEIFRLRLIYAAIAGLICNLTQIEIPELLLQPVDVRTGDDSNYADKSGLSASRCGIAAMGPRARRSTVADFRRLCGGQYCRKFNRRRGRKPTGPTSLRRSAGRSGYLSSPKNIAKIQD
jgi:hypothetical protein